MQEKEYIFGADTKFRPSGSLAKPHDAKQWQSDGLFYPSLTPMKDYTCSHTIEPRHEKTCLRVFDQVRLKSACAATEARWRLKISDIETRGIILSRQRKKALIRQHGCAGWSAPLLFAYGINRFSPDEAQLIIERLVDILKMFSHTLDKTSSYTHFTMLEFKNSGVLDYNFFLETLPSLY